MQMKPALLSLFLFTLSLDIVAGSVPDSVRHASELAALPGGHWLALEQHQLRLVDAAGQQRAVLSIRGKALDSRSSTDGALAALIDSDTQESLLVTVDTVRGQLAIRQRLPSPEFALETICLYRDIQHNEQLFQIGKDGRAQQWLLGDGGTPLLLRQLAVPPGSEHCRVDDANNRLFVSEAAFGLWMYAADGEGAPIRHLITDARQRGAGALAVIPNGIAMLDVKGRHTQVWTSTPTGWRATGQALSNAGANSNSLLLYDKALLLRGKSGWHRLGVDLPSQAAPATALPVVMARTQTESVARFGDAADDPAIWLHATDPLRSLVLATNKKQGLLSYDLAGRQQQLLEAGRLNNVDVRQGVRFGDRSVDLAIATQRDERALAIFEIDSEGQMRDAGRIATELTDIYGTCLYRPAAGGLEVFANDKDGRFSHYRLAMDADGRYHASLLRSFRMRSQPEGCVVDDRRGRLFVGEEKRGIWSLAATANVAYEAQLILPVGQHLVADVEGLALYQGASGHYLIASSQGNNSYVVLDAEPPYAYRGAFRIGINQVAKIDGVSDTDGLELSAANLGGSFNHGMLVVQDGYKRLPDGAQNFKYVAWQDIARALGLP